MTYEEACAAALSIAESADDTVQLTAYMIGGYDGVPTKISYLLAINVGAADDVHWFRGGDLERLIGTYAQLRLLRMDTPEMMRASRAAGGR